MLQVWVKPPGELPFLYGNHVVKAHLGRITEDTPEHQGVVVYSMADVPLVSRIRFGYLGCNLMHLVILGLWRYCAVDSGYQKDQPNGSCSFPSGVGILAKPQGFPLLTVSLVFELSLPVM